MATVELPIVVLDPFTPYGPVPGASVSVLRRSGGPATVFVDAGKSAIRSQPLATDPQGRVEGWVERGSYEVEVSVPGRAIYVEYFDAAPAEDGAIDENWIGDGEVTLDKLDTNSVDRDKIQNREVTQEKIELGAVGEDQLADDGITTVKIRDHQVTQEKIFPGAVGGAALDPNVVPLGTVIDWWRPTTSTAVPTGWAICDGRNWTSIPNAWSLATGTIPNLVGKVTMGARQTKQPNGAGGSADGLASSNGDAFVNAPGIGGLGGSNALQTHTHTIANHTHGIQDGGGHAHPMPHTHTLNSHRHPINSHTHTIDGHTHTIAGHQHQHVGPISFPAGNDYIVFPNSHLGNDQSQSWFDVGGPGTGYESHDSRTIKRFKLKSSTVDWEYDDAQIPREVVNSTFESLETRTRGLTTNNAPGAYSDAPDNDVTTQGPQGPNGANTETAGGHNHGGVTDPRQPAATPVDIDIRPAHVGMLKLMKVLNV